VPGALIGTDCILGGVRVMRHLYEVDGWGVGEVWTREDVVVQHELASPGLERQGSGDEPRFVAELVRRVSLHLAGHPVAYEDVPLDLEWATPFQRALAAALRAVPWGEVVSYGELAALAGRPGAARAAGSFCADNRYALIVPCHRVVAAGSIGGYGTSGVELKRRLLALEGVRL
jgi:methylated-DNA-[protein]-cysteine S-methyltransferase